MGEGRFTLRLGPGAESYKNLCCTVAASGTPTNAPIVDSTKALSALAGDLQQGNGLVTTKW